MPKIPKEFQTHLVGSFSQGTDSGKPKAASYLILYDFFDRRAELIISEDTQRTRQIYYYDKNEFFTISKNNVILSDNKFCVFDFLICTRKRKWRM